MLRFKAGLTDENDDFDGLLATIIFAVLLGCFITGWSFFIRGTEFDFEKFGTGIAALVGAGGMGYGAKRLGEKYGKSSTTDS